jgi:hypothetical protein
VRRTPTSDHIGAAKTGSVRCFHFDVRVTVPTGKDRGIPNGDSNEAVPVLWCGSADECARMRHVRTADAAYAGRRSSGRWTATGEDDVRLRGTADSGRRPSSSRSATCGRSTCASRCTDGRRISAGGRTRRVPTATATRIRSTAGWIWWSAGGTAGLWPTAGCATGWLRSTRTTAATGWLRPTTGRLRRTTATAGLRTAAAAGWLWWRTATAGLRTAAATGWLRWRTATAGLRTAAATGWLWWSRTIWVRTTARRTTGLRTTAAAGRLRPTAGLPAGEPVRRSAR